MNTLTPDDSSATPLLDDQQYRLLVDSITDYAIYMLNPDGVIASWNAGAERFKGYHQAEIIGRNFAMFYTAEDRANGEPQRALEIASTTGRFESEGWRVRKNGDRFWASVVIDPILDQGKLLGFAKITRDISERKLAERALIQANAALLQSQKMEAVGQLTGGIAHDFNNLLTAVLGSLELLRRRMPNDAKAMRLLENAVQGARRGTVLTQRMLAFARRQDLSLETIDLPTLVRNMLQLMEPALGSAVTLETHLPAKLDTILVDGNQLEMALLNLVVNARDAMETGGVIVIDVQDAELADGEILGLPAGAYARLSVTDTGTGMDETTLQRATEPFYTTKPPGLGTGLGLSMVHGMAIHANGRLILKSEAGKGTTAEIWIPLTGKILGADGTAITERRLKHPQFVVLAVDDDPLVLLNTVTMLEDFGCKVFEARSGKQALELLAAQPSIELVITDMMMPQMTGFELFLAASELYPNLRFLLATGYADNPDAGELLLPLIIKPFWQVDLERAIHDVFASSLPTSRILKFPNSSMAPR